MDDLIKKGQREELLQRLESFDKWLLLIHENPDGDTLGCGLAMYSFALRIGKSARILGKSNLPDSYLFLPFATDYEQKQQLTADDAGNDTLIICIDTSTVERSVGGLDDLIKEGNSINIDHHGDNKKYAGLNIVVPEASATAEIIAEILVYSGAGISKDEAICLYAALVTDNGYFKFKSTTPHSHLCAALLLEAGAVPSELDDMINKNMTSPIMRLWGNALCRAETFACGEAAMFWLDDADFRRADAGPSAVDGLVNLLLRIKGVKIALLLSAIDSEIKLSVRTRAPYSAREIAEIWGGGGHLQASGAKLRGMSFEEAEKAVKEAVIRYVAGGISTTQ